MKRILAFVLCLCMVVGATSAFAVDKVNVNLMQVTEEDRNNGTAKTIASLATVGDTLYVLTDTTLESWKPGDTQATVVNDKVFNTRYADQEMITANEKANNAAYSKLFTDAETLYGLDSTTGKVWRLADAQGILATPEMTVQLDWTSMIRKAEEDEYTYNPELYDIAVMDGMLYITCTDWYTGTQTNQLDGWDLKTGAFVKSIEDKAIRSVTPYKDGLLLCKIYDDATSWDEATQTQKKPDLATVNFATEEVTTLLTFDNTSVVCPRYVAATDTLYYIAGSVVYSLPGLQQPAKVSAYLPNSVWEDAACLLLPSGMMAIGDYNGLIVRGLDMPGIENGALTVYGEYGSSGHQAYIAAYPQASVTVSDEYYNTLEEFTNAMVAGTSTVDVLRMDSDYSPMSRLIDKGYALDLSAYPEITAIADQMEPTLVSFGMKDGKLYAVPVDISANTLGVYMDNWKAIGLTEDDVPKTFMEMMDFFENWDADYAEDYPDYMLSDSGTESDSLFNWLNTNYIAYETKLGETISFDTELYRKLLTKFDGIDFSSMTTNTDSEDYWSRKSLFTFYDMASYPEQYQYNATMMIIPLDEGLVPVITASLQLMMINPRSTRLDQAVQYVTTYAQNLDFISAAITLVPDNNEAIINTSFEANLQSWKDQIAQYETDIKTATAEDQAGLKESITYLQDMVDHSDQYRYRVSAETIATYREQVAPYLVVVGQTPFNVWDDNGENELYTLQSQYLQDAITMDQYVKEIDKRMRMMQLEDQ